MIKTMVVGVRKKFSLGLRHPRLFAPKKRLLAIVGAIFCLLIHKSLLFSYFAFRPDLFLVVCIQF
jgi:hypothetical protein